MSSLLAISIGNTRVGLGLFERPLPGAAPAPVRVRSCLLAEQTSFWPSFEPDSPPEAVVIASVNPAADGPAAEWATGRLGVALLRFPQDVPPLIENQCRPPDATGADRLAAAVAAHAEFGPPCIIVDAGTAITVDAVGGDPPAFLGGAILPGIRLAADALARSTALVPEIPHLSPGPAIGISTADAVASGVLRGLAGAVDRIIADVTSELSGSAPVITTGGNADLLSALCRTEMQVRPHLVLTGLAVAYFGLGARAPE